MCSLLCTLWEIRGKLLMKSVVFFCCETLYAMKSIRSQSVLETQFASSKQFANKWKRFGQSSTNPVLTRRNSILRSSLPKTTSSQIQPLNERGNLANIKHKIYAIMFLPVSHNPLICMRLPRLKKVEVGVFKNKDNFDWECISLTLPGGRIFLYKTLTIPITTNPVIVVIS